MHMRKLMYLFLLLAVCNWAQAQASSLDSAHSIITVKVEKTGLFSAFAHNHEIQAPLASGDLDPEKRTAKLVFNTKDMRVLDEGVRDSEKADVEHTMKSKKVLDVEKF